MDAKYITGLSGWFQGEAEQCADDQSLINVSGIYCIYTQRFTPEHSLALKKVFEQLPGLRSGPDEAPCFYGANESVPQFLT
ncbi:MAG TPA: hypothetical protein VF928_04025 [Usitatibacteraceae bacterium]